MQNTPIAFGAEESRIAIVLVGDLGSSRNIKVNKEISCSYAKENIFHVCYMFLALYSFKFALKNIKEQCHSAK